LRLRRKTYEGFGVVGGEDPADLSIPQRGCCDLDRFCGAAIVLGRNPLQRFVVKDNFSTQPSRGAMGILKSAAPHGKKPLSARVRLSYPSVRAANRGVDANQEYSGSERC